MNNAVELTFAHSNELIRGWGGGVVIFRDLSNNSLVSLFLDDGYIFGEMRAGFVSLR